MRQVTIEPTANEKVMKFVAEYTLVPGSLEFDRSSDVADIPLAQELFKYPFVDKIFITANFIAVAKQDSVEWEHIAESLREVIQDQLLEHPRIYKEKKRELFPIYAEMTPNPAVMKFVSQRYIVEGFLEIKSKDQAAHIPLAQALFDEFTFVKEVFISDNFVAVTKDHSVEWHEVMVPVRSFIADFLQAGNKVSRSEEHTSELQSRENLVCRLLLEKKKNKKLRMQINQ